MEYVEDYWIEYYDSGIIHLLFNTTERWIEYHRMDDHTYRIGPSAEDVEVYKKRLIEIPRNKLVFQIGKLYLSTVFQEKDQLSFYFIPFNLITRGNDEDKFFFQKCKL